MCQKDGSVLACVDRVKTEQGVYLCRVLIGVEYSRDVGEGAVLGVPYRTCRDTE